MKKTFVPTVLFFYLFVFSAFILPQERKMHKNTVALDWGNNYYGNTFGISYNRLIHNHFSVGFTISFGGFKYTFPPHGTKFHITNNLSEDLTNSIKFHYIANTSIYWHRKQNKRFTILNTFGLGVGRYYVTFRQKTTREREGIPGEYEGSKEYSRNALFLTVNLLEYKQQKFPFFAITMGVKANLSNIKMPQSYVLTNYYRYMVVTQDGTGYYLIPYIEGFFRVSFTF